MGISYRVKHFWTTTFYGSCCLHGISITCGNPSHLKILHHLLSYRSSPFLQGTIDPHSLSSSGNGPRSKWDSASGRICSDAGGTYRKDSSPGTATKLSNAVCRRTSSTAYSTSATVAACSSSRTSGLSNDLHRVIVSTNCYYLKSCLKPFPSSGTCFRSVQLALMSQLY